jgi:hypothetical protein
MSAYTDRISRYHAQAEHRRTQLEAHAEIPDTQERWTLLNDDAAFLRQCCYKIDEQIREARIDGVDVADLEPLLAQAREWVKDAIRAGVM